MSIQQFRRSGFHGICLALLSSHCVWAAPSFPIGLAPVSAAVLRAHPELTGGVFELPVSVEAREPEPVLRAGPLQTWPTTAHEAMGSVMLGRVRLQCQSSAVCLPFYVLVHLSDASKAALRAAKSSQFLTNAVATTAKADGTHALHHGTRVHLLIDSGLLHLRIPVVCLQDGDLGNPIRVQSVDRRVTYLATVVDPFTVRGSL